MSFLIKRPMISGHANARIVNGPKEVSIACDDSCGEHRDLSRSDIRLFRNDVCVTREVWPEYESYSIVYASIENLEKALAWLKEA